MGCDISGQRHDACLAGTQPTNGKECKMTLEDAKAIVAAYEDLLDHALDTLIPFGQRGSVNDDTAQLKFAGDSEPTVFWHEYESDYYGGGSLACRDAPVDRRLLLMGDEDLEKEIEAVKAEEKERNARLLAAQAAVHNERTKAFELAMYAQLHAKYGPKK
jgi:hypothetical protein